MFVIHKKKIGLQTFLEYTTSHTVLFICQFIFYLLIASCAFMHNVAFLKWPAFICGFLKHFIR